MNTKKFNTVHFPSMSFKLLLIYNSVNQQNNFNGMTIVKFEL